MSFNAECFGSILQGIIIGILFAVCFLKIAKIKDNFNYFKETTLKFMEDEVKSLMRDKYNKVSREELTTHINYLEKRILVIETKMQEKEKSSRSENRTQSG